MLITYMCIYQQKIKSQNCPNIAELVDAYEDDRNFYLVTQYCAGGHYIFRMFIDCTSIIL